MGSEPEEEKVSPTTSSISRKKLNIKPMSEPEVNKTPEPEVKKSAAPITRKKLNIKPMEPEIGRNPEPEVQKTTAARNRKLVIKPVQADISETHSTNLEPLPPLPFCPAKKKIIIKNIPKSGNTLSETISEPQKSIQHPVRKLTIKDVVPPER